MTEARTVRVTRHYPQSPERVFDAWLDPAMAGRFLFATPTGEMVRVEIDARPGGAFRFTDRRDGQDVDHVGTYETIQRPSRLVFSFTVPAYSQAATRVEIDITPADGGGSELVLTHRGVLPDYEAQTRQGWGMILESLGRALG